LGEFLHAAEEFKAAYKISGKPELLFNTAQAYRMANVGAQALHFYKAFLVEEPNTKLREDVLDRIRKLEGAEPAGALAAPQDGSPSVDTAERIEVEPANAPMVGTQAEGNESARKPTYKKWWVWTIAGTLVVGAALGIGLGVGLTLNQSPGARYGNHDLF
jgi:hypothetical protein